MHVNNFLYNYPYNEGFKLGFLSNRDRYINCLFFLQKHVKRLYDNLLINFNLLSKINSELYQIFRLINKDDLDQPDSIPYDKNEFPFLKSNKKVPKKILKFCYDCGFYNICIFLESIIGSDYYLLFENNQRKTLELYNQIFIPLYVHIQKDNNQTKTNINIKKNNKQSNTFFINKILCRNLLNDICDIRIYLKPLEVEIVFQGYIQLDDLNLFFHYFQESKNLKNDIQKNCPWIDKEFLKKYFKYCNLNFFFIYSGKEIMEKIKNDYILYHHWCSKKMADLIKEFIDSDIHDMFHMIQLLLLGNKQNNYMANTLFHLLDNKSYGQNLGKQEKILHSPKKMDTNLSEIIYRNLTHQSRSKIRTIDKDIKDEIKALKQKNIGDIPIDVRLALHTHLPIKVKNYIIDKMKELTVNNENSYKIQMAIDGLMKYPWKTEENNFFNFPQFPKSEKKEKHFLMQIAHDLDETIYGHEKSKQTLLELMAKWVTNPQSEGQIIGLLGPPGVGKTLFAKSLSKSLKIPLVHINLGGMNDASDLVGHSFTYANAQYGMIVRQMINSGCWRCIMFFDEVDKVARKNDINEIYSVLIHITDKNMNKNFQDRFYSSAIDFDLSGVLMIFSYNDEKQIDPILYDRINEIKINAYVMKEKVNIAQKYILRNLMNDINLSNYQIFFSNKMIEYIIENYTNEAGARDLERKLERILLKLNLDHIYSKGPFYLKKIEYKNNNFGENFTESARPSENSYGKNNLQYVSKIFINTDLIHRYLEYPMIQFDKINDQNFIGVVNGLYATAMGQGGIITIQIYKNYFQTDKKIKLTGNQKKVMKESVNCALTVALDMLTPNYRENVSKEFPYGFHIHVPDGGTPKDGPSAGIAFTVAFYSLFMKKKINRFAAMTGEIQLTGKVSKIGGLDIKLMGAKRAGVRRVYICQENQTDYEIFMKKNPEIFQNFEIRIIDHVSDLLNDTYLFL
jgi:endopeptidase La